MVAQDHKTAAAREFIILIKIASAGRSDTERFKVTGRHAEGREAHGFNRSRELNVAAGKGGQRLKGVITRSKVAKVEGVHGELRIGVAAEEHPNHAVRSRIGQSLQQHAVNHAKDSAVGTDAEP